jgi:hypothetical protein
MELPDAAAEAVKNDLRDIFNMAVYSYYLRPNVLLRRRDGFVRVPRADFKKISICE